MDFQRKVCAVLLPRHGKMFPTAVGSFQRSKFQSHEVKVSGHYADRLVAEGGGEHSTESTPHKKNDSKLHFPTHKKTTK